MAKRRVAELLAPPELLREKAGHVVAHRERERGRVRLERLDDHLPRRIAPTPARELRDELERPLLRAEVGEREAGVRIDDRSDRHPGEVVPLGDHLRAHEHRGARAREALECVPERLRLRRRVRIEPDALEARQATGELRLELLRARSDAGELDRAAVRAVLGKRLRVAAVVAVQALVAVERQRDVAAPARAARGRTHGSGSHPRRRGD